MIQVSLLSKLKGFRSLIVHGLMLVTMVLAAAGVIPNPLDAVAANQLADSAEAVANAAENVQDSGAVTAGVMAIYAAVNIVLRMLTKTPVGKKV